MSAAGLVRFLVDVGAGRARNHGRSEAQVFARIDEGIACRVAEETLEPVDVLEEPQTTGERPAVIDVPGDIRENGVVLIGAQFLGQPDRVVPASDRDDVADPVDHVPFLNVVGLPLVEQAADRAQRQLSGRGQPELVAFLGVASTGLRVLRRVHRVRKVINPIDPVAGQGVIEERVVRIVRVRVNAALHVRASIEQIETSDLSLDGESRLIPVILRPFRLESGDLQVAQVRVVREVAVGLLRLRHECGGHGPVFAQVDLERDAAAHRRDIIVVFADVGVVVDRAAPGWIGARGRHVVDVAGVVLVPADDPQGGEVVHRQVDVTLDAVADVALGDAVDLSVDGGAEVVQVGLFGDQTDRAGLGAGPVKRALRPGQRLDPLHVVDVHVERALDGRDRLLVEIDADAGQGAGMVAVTAAGHAAHVNAGEAG